MCLAEDFYLLRNFHNNMPHFLVGSRAGGGCSSANLLGPSHRRAVVAAGPPACIAILALAAARCQELTHLSVPCERA